MGSVLSLSPDMVPLVTTYTCMVVGRSGGAEGVRRLIACGKGRLAGAARRRDRLCKLVDEIDVDAIDQLGPHDRRQHRNGGHQHPGLQRRDRLAEGALLLNQPYLRREDRMQTGQWFEGLLGPLVSTADSKANSNTLHNHRYVHCNTNTYHDTT